MPSNSKSIAEQKLDLRFTISEIEAEIQTLEILEMFNKEAEKHPHAYLSYSYKNVRQNFSADSMFFVCWFRAIYKHVVKDFGITTRLAFIERVSLPRKASEQQKQRWLEIMNWQIAKNISPNVELVFKNKEST